MFNRWTLPALLFLVVSPLAADPKEGAGKVLGVTLEPGKDRTRITLRCSRPACPVLRADLAAVDLPDTRAGALPARLRLGPKGKRFLLAGRSGEGLRLSVGPDRPAAVSLVPGVDDRLVTLEVWHPQAPPGKQPFCESSLLPPARLVSVALAPVGKRVQVQVMTTGPARLRHGFLPGSTPRCFLDVGGAFLEGPAVVSLPPRDSPVLDVRVAQFRAEPPICRVVLTLRPGAKLQDLFPEDRPPALLFAAHRRPVRSRAYSSGPPAAAPQRQPAPSRRVTRR